jgi:DNA-binding MarR family transcriptional regulator
MSECPVTAGVRSVTDPIEQVEREITVLIRRTLETLWANGYGDEPVDRYTYPVLALLDAHGALGLSELARRLGLTKPTTSRHVARLSTAGLVTTRPDTRAVRAIVVDLTPAGIGVVARLRAARHERLAAVLSGWSDEDRDTLGALLARLNVDLDAHRAGRTAV